MSAVIDITVLVVLIVIEVAAVRCMLTNILAHFSRGDVRVTILQIALEVTIRFEERLKDIWNKIKSCSKMNKLSLLTHMTKLILYFALIKSWGRRSSELITELVGVRTLTTKNLAISERAVIMKEFAMVLVNLRAEVLTEHFILPH